MGKCKKRAFNKAKNSPFTRQMTRQEALITVMTEFNDDPSSMLARELITLFGLTAEELSEVGASYEILRSLDFVLN